MNFVEIHLQNSVMNILLDVIKVYVTKLTQNCTCTSNVRLGFKIVRESVEKKGSWEINGGLLPC